MVLKQFPDIHLGEKHSGYDIDLCIPTDLRVTCLKVHAISHVSVSQTRKEGYIRWHACGEQSEFLSFVC